jgi:hypothetical protein
MGFVFRNEGEWRFSFMPPSRTGIYQRGDVRSVAVIDKGDRLFLGINGGSVESVARKK